MIYGYWIAMPSYSQNHESFNLQVCWKMSSILLMFVDVECLKPYKWEAWMMCCLHIAMRISNIWIWFGLINAIHESENILITNKNRKIAYYVPKELNIHSNDFGSTKSNGTEHINMYLQQILSLKFTVLKLIIILIKQSSLIQFLWNFNLWLEMSSFTKTLNLHVRWRDVLKSVGVKLQKWL